MLVLLNCKQNMQEIDVYLKFYVYFYEILNKISNCS